MNIVVTDSENQELFSCSIDEAEKAFQFARDMEALDIDVKIIAPSLPETLINAIGSTEADRLVLQKVIDEEISDHL